MIGLLIAQVWIPPMNQMYQPSLNVPPGQWGQPSGQPQRPGARDNGSFNNEQNPPQQLRSRSNEGISSPSSYLSNFNGTYAGKYTMSILFGMSSKGILNLQQQGDQVTGVLTTKTGRSANIFGVVRGQQFTGTLVFTDKCSGQGSMVAELLPSGDILTGKYNASDCVGRYSGRFKLIKQ